jgi:hypothetical protein
LKNTVHAEPAHIRVTGRVVGVPEGAHASLMILQRGMHSEGRIRADGKFELWRLDPGKYTLSAQWQAPNGEHVQTVGAVIEIGNSNIDNICVSAIVTSPEV